MVVVRGGGEAAILFRMVYVGVRLHDDEIRRGEAYIGRD